LRVEGRSAKGPYETQEWEYKVVLKNAAEERLLSEQELKELGVSGWKLVEVVGLPGKVQFYFKRGRA